MSPNLYAQIRRLKKKRDEYEEDFERRYEIILEEFKESVSFIRQLMQKQRDNDAAIKTTLEKLKNDADDVKCPICLEHINGVACGFGCGHCFCEACSDEWSKSGTTCPMCRGPLEPQVSIFVHQKTAKRKKATLISLLAHVAPTVLLRANITLSAFLMRYGYTRS